MPSQQRTDTKKKLSRSLQYANDVLSGKSVACNYVKLACERHLKDLKKAESDDYPFYFDQEDADRYTQFIEMLNLWKGVWAGKPLVLEGWQSFIVQVLLGWKNKSTGNRRFKKAYIEMARKNAKTTLMAAISLAIVFIDGEAGGQVYSGATKEAQAQIVINDMGRIAQATPDLNERFVYRKNKGGISRVVYEDTATFIAPLGRDSHTQDGFDPSVAVIDEYHAHDDDDLIDVIESGMGARQEPLLMIITTAGFDRTKPCFSFRNNVVEVLKSYRTDESLFGIIYTLDDGDDWTDESVWVKSNPNLGVSTSVEFMREQAIDAQNRTSKRGAFLTKNMNIWVDSLDTWIPTERWDEGQQEFTIEDMAGAECYGGLDLASTKDINAFTLYFPNFKDGKSYILSYFFSPKYTARTREKEDKVPYLQWANDGWMTLTDGQAYEKTDYEYIESKILELSNQVNIVRINYDSWNSSQLVLDLKNAGIKMEPQSQGYPAMSYPTKEVEKEFLNGKIVHNGNPCMAWMMRNVQLSTDTNDNVKIDKKRSTEKVDGPVSLVMAKCAHIQETWEPDTTEEYYVA